MGCHVFIAASVDGYIATDDGGVEWLDVPGTPVLDDGTADDAGWADFIGGVDALVMGRNTFEKVLTFGEWPYDLPVTVASSTLAEVPAELVGRVEVSALAPAELVAHLASSGRRELYVDGGQLITSFLRAGLVDDMTITTIPVVLGSGLPLFGAVPRATWLDLVASRVLSNGMVQTTYRCRPVGDVPAAQAPRRGAET